MLLDLGGESSNLAVFDQGSFGLACTLSVGVNHFCRRIAEQRVVSMRPAARSLAVTLYLEGVQEIADELVAQIRRSLEFYLYNVGMPKK